jgi:light-regulated signal transduction histidine kinase (bacteriophytochrome)
MLCKEFSNNPIKDHNGKIVGVNCIARDISEQRRQFMKIQQQNEKLIEIAWIQSHRVRSPVSSILGLAELFDFQASGNEHNAEILDLIKTATNQLDDIIREVVEKTEVLGQQ